MGARLLVAAGLIETVRLAALRWLQPALPLWVLVPALLAFALLLATRLGRVRLSQLGLRPWSAWSTTEKSYFLQVLVLANVVFPLLLFARPSRGSPSDLALGLTQVFLPYLFFGFYQELVYRGLLQLGLVRRWGPVLGAIAANLLYTLGPLHWNHFGSPASTAVPMFAAIFAIGLFFGALYHRSGNLWIVAVFHAIGNAYIAWGARVGG